MKEEKAFSMLIMAQGHVHVCCSCFVRMLHVSVTFLFTIPNEPLL